MKSYESTLAFSYSRRICRLFSFLLQPTVNSKYVSMFISFVSIISLFSSAIAVEQPPQTRLILVTQQSSLLPNRLSSTLVYSKYPYNSSAISNLSRKLTVSTGIPPSLSSIHHGFNQNAARGKTKQQTELRSLPLLVIIIIICSLMTIITIVGNLVVILAVCLVRKLQTASNILIVSLAVSDILVGLFIMPLAMVYEMYDSYWPLGSIMCDIWTSTDVLLCTASILNFLVISIDRYCIINHPFKYAPMRKVKLLSLMIAGVWILSALVSLPPILGWGRPSENLPLCQVNDKLDYQIFATMLSFYIPLIVVLIIYANIYRTAQTAVDNRSSVQMPQYLTHNYSTVNVATTNINSSAGQQQSNGDTCSTRQPSSINLDENNKDNSKKSTENSNRTLNEERRGGKRSTKNSSNNPSGRKSLSLLNPSRCLGRRISTPFNSRLSVFVTRRYSFFRHVHLPNQKAIRTLGVILGTFIVCWLPFMLFAIIKPLYKSIKGFTGPPQDLNAPDWIDPVLLWFGYSSSMLNPLIYSKFNREFRTPFREIMYGRCRGLNDKIRRQDYLENLYGDSHIPTAPLNIHHQQAAVHTQAAGCVEAAV